MAERTEDQAPREPEVQLRPALPLSHSGASNSPPQYQLTHL